MGLILITHDLGVVADVADRVAVMYAGRIVETGNIYDVFARPAHAYTRGLLDSLPGSERERLRPIPGAPPNMLRPPSGCAFRARCAYATEACAGDMPVLRPMGSLDTACVRAEELVQEVMLTVWQRADRYDPALANAATWIFTIARNRRIELKLTNR